MGTEPTLWAVRSTGWLDRGWSHSHSLTFPAPQDPEKRHPVLVRRLFTGPLDDKPCLAQEAQRCGPVKTTPVHGHTQPVGFQPRLEVSQAERSQEPPARP